jgi:hypothetical protein
VKLVPIAKHLAETSFLIRPDNGSGLEINIEVGIDGIVAKIVFLEHRILQLVTPLLDILCRHM